MKLVALPEELIDYVILHELVHTRIHNHSGRFWAELSKHVKDANALASRLREYDLRLLWRVSALATSPGKRNPSNFHSAVY